MDHPYEFTLKGRRRATVAEVEEALRGVTPERVRTNAVEVGGVRFPVKQAFSVAFGVKPAEFGAHKARKVFLDMGFTVTTSPMGKRKEGGPDPATRTQPGAVRPRFPRAAGLPRPARWEADPDDGTPAAQVQALEIPPIVLAWSPWERWNDLKKDERLRTGARVPAGRPGVYEVIREHTLERLTIGRASDLRERVKAQLVRGVGPHPAGTQIREHEDTSRVLVRWAVTDRAAAAEEELHRQHIRQHGRLPKYTQRT